MIWTLTLTWTFLVISTVTFPLMMMQSKIETDDEIDLIEVILTSSETSSLRHRHLCMILNVDLVL